MLDTELGTLPVAYRTPPLSYETHHTSYRYRLSFLAASRGQIQVNSKKIAIQDIVLSNSLVVDCMRAYLKAD